MPVSHRQGILTTMTTPEEALRQLARAARAVERAETRLREAVQAAVEAGAGWPAIAQALGVSRQSAWERFHDEKRS